MSSSISSYNVNGGYQSSPERKNKQQRPVSEPENDTDMEVSIDDGGGGGSGGGGGGTENGRN